MIEENDLMTQRKIVDRFLQQLTREDPQMYYSTTSEVARSLHTMIKDHTNRLSVEEQTLVRHLTIEDIQGILGFHSK